MATAGRPYYLAPTSVDCHCSNRRPEPRPRTAVRVRATVEAAGVEPASARSSTRASTCVDHWLISYMSRSVNNRTPTIRQLSWPSPNGRGERCSPNYRRLVEPPRAGNSGDGPVRFTYAASAISVLALEVFPAFLRARRGPRHATQVLPNTSKPFRPLCNDILTYCQPAASTVSSR